MTSLRDGRTRRTYKTAPVSTAFYSRLPGFYARMKKPSVGRRLQRRPYEALGHSYSCILLQNPSITKSATKMTGSEISHVLKEGELEKRSDNLLQLWKRKTCVLTTDSLNIYADNQKKNKSKELKLQSIKKVDCVERTGKFVYFTIVTTDNKEIDFRCPGEENCWNAVITMALIDFQNRKAIQDFKTQQESENTSLGQQERCKARAP
ncbi:pleckstrin homology-like domain family A member 2 [Sinocyclocheilus anshuiensis]|uniref:pleckstrin homology-like domain family A member 2 n=1 Tax=Sinocyclocheilus anshuiensis TaxID=1608454 RepID=UPI0007BA778F|nr:PREDICTED: pleckstrin homology-like domain family A member 2 [Sinocyclocheilus anshuiensis]